MRSLIFYFAALISKNRLNLTELTLHTNVASNMDSSAESRLHMEAQRLFLIRVGAVRDRNAPVNQSLDQNYSAADIWAKNRGSQRSGRSRAA